MSSTKRRNYGKFEGVGDKGIVWLQEIQEKYEMEVMTEVILPSHVEKALAGVDVPIFIKIQCAQTLTCGKDV